MPKTIKVRVPCDGELWRQQGVYYIVHSGGKWMEKSVQAYELGHSFPPLEDVPKLLRTMSNPCACSHSAEHVFEGHDGWKFIADDWREWARDAVESHLSSLDDDIQNIRTALGELE